MNLKMPHEILLAAPALVWAAAPAPATPTLTLANITFGPAPSGLRVGDRMQWVNSG
jgi:hypothetical protein